MADIPFINGVDIAAGDGVTPTEGFTHIDKITEFSGLGKTNALSEVTNFDSGNSKEFIAGISEGKVITLACLYLPANAGQAGLKADVDSGNNRNMQVTITDGTDPLVLTFPVTALDWEFDLSYTDANVIKFQLKIAGAIV